MLSVITESEVKDMAKNELAPIMTSNEQVKDIVDFIKLIAMLNDTQKAKLEGIAIGMSLEKCARQNKPA